MKRRGSNRRKCQLPVRSISKQEKNQQMERKWWTLLASCIAIFMLLLDVTIVNVALPSIERDLGADFSDLQWVIDAYALTLAGLMLAAGSLADMVGRRLVFMLGLGSSRLRRWPAGWLPTRSS
jgi:MFS family permease